VYEVSIDDVSKLLGGKEGVKKKKRRLESLGKLQCFGVGGPNKMTSSKSA